MLKEIQMSARGELILEGKIIDYESMTVVPLRSSMGALGEDETRKAFYERIVEPNAPAEANAYLLRVEPRARGNIVPIIFFRVESLPSSSNMSLSRCY